jgi:hypothetical protein
MLILLLGVFLSSSAFARISIGNGGQVVQCKNPDGSVTNEAFDLYEGRSLFGYAYPQDSESLDPAKLALALAGQMDQAQGSIPGLHEIDKNTLANRVKYVLDNMRLLRPGEGLQPTGDTKEFIKLPANCDFEQAINFRDSKRIYASSDIWTALSPVNKAAMLLHEAVYWYLRETGVEVDSRRTRNAVSYIMSGGNLTPTTEVPTNVARFQFCHSTDKKGKGGYSTKFIAYRGSDGELVAQFLQIGGHRVLTRSVLTGEAQDLPDLPIDKSVRPVQKIEGGLVSPIDVDSLLSITWGKNRVVVGGILQPSDGVYDPVVCDEVRL